MSTWRKPRFGSHISNKSQTPDVLFVIITNWRPVDSISDETVRKTLKNALKPWLKDCWCISAKANADFVCAGSLSMVIY
jgi:hypothetical protein